jgi:hypothetical protein
MHVAHWAVVIQKAEIKRISVRSVAISTAVIVNYVQANILLTAIFVRLDLPPKYIRVKPVRRLKRTLATRIRTGRRNTSVGM